MATLAPPAPAPSGPPAAARADVGVLVACRASGPALVGRAVASVAHRSLPLRRVTAGGEHRWWCEFRGERPPTGAEVGGLVTRLREAGIPVAEDGVRLGPRLTG
jgi:hypothetical protein